ncbi:sulfur carrier protein ThiS [Porphyromonas sp.]
MLPHVCTIPEALAFAAIDLPPRSAIAVNERLVPRTALATYQLEEGDTLLLIRPTFGG